MVVLGIRSTEPAVVTSVIRLNRLMSIGSRTFLACLCLFCLGSCATYRPQPLDDQAVNAALAAPDPASVRIAASSIHHPVLKPVTLDLSSPLGPDQVAILAVLANPGLRALRHGRALAGAQVVQAGILPNPQLSLTADHPVGGSDAGTVNAFGLGLTWDVTSLIGRDARIAAAQAAADGVALDVAWQEWQVALAARLAATRLVALTAQAQLSDTMVTLLRAAAKRSTEAIERGFLTGSEGVQAQAAAHDASTTFAQVRHDIDRQRILLTQALGLPPGTAVPLDTPAFASRPITEARKLAEAWSKDLRQRRLDLLALACGYQSGEETLRAAIMAQFPKISFGLQQGRDNTNVVSTGFGLVIDLPIFDRNQGAIAGDLATRDKLFAEYIDRLSTARNDLTLAGIDCDSLAERLGPARQHADASRTWSQRLSAAVSSQQALQADADAAHLAELQAAMEVLLLEQQLAESAIAFELAAGSLNPSPLDAQSQQRHTAESR